MNNIDVELFKYQWDQVQTKMQAIIALPKLWAPLCRYITKRISIDGDGINYEEHDSEGDSDSFTVRWDELNNHIDYFREKFQKEIQDKAQREKDAREEEERRNKEKRQNEYLALKREFEQ
jgi:hypothetical protein